MKQIISQMENIKSENQDCRLIKRQKRSNKPAMEKRRRERINGCLEQLKNHVLLAEGKDPARYTKVEKADILEMTVRFLTSKPKVRQTDLATPSTGLQYKTGYKACMNDLQRVLSSSDDNMPCGAKDRLLQHLKSINIRMQTEEGTSITGNQERIRHNNDLTVYIPPNNTWSPPVVHPNPSYHPCGMENMCSPPASPENMRPDSPLTASSPSDLSCTILQPRNFNSGGRVTTKKCYQETIQPREYWSFDEQTVKYETSTPPPLSSSRLRSQTLVQDFTNLNPFQSPSPPPFCSPSPCVSPDTAAQPQIVPLNLATSKNLQLQNIEKNVRDQTLSHLPPSKRYSKVLTAECFDKATGDMFPDSHWRPW